MCLLNTVNRTVADLMTEETLHFLELCLSTVLLTSTSIRLTSPCIEDPLAPPLLYSKTGVYPGISLLFHTNRFILSTILSSM